MASNTIFYFAWVAQTANTWSPTYARHDENVFNFELGCEEGQIPKLTIEVINPRIGPLAPGRLYWAWFSMSPDGGVTLVPLFFGRIVGLPQTILFNTVKYELIARSPTYIQQKQLVAESLKVAPNYDPIFLDVQKRDDPDAILEGWSSLYAVDRVTNAVSASDILIGEDGTISVQQADTFYDSVQMKLQQSPLVAVNVKAEVTWEQQHTGYFFVGQWAFPTLGSEPFVGDWPKSGSNLGGGYSGAVCWAGIRDPFVQISASANLNITYHFQNTMKFHALGDVMSIDANSSWPTQPMTLTLLTNFQQAGIVSPFTVDVQGFPDPTNIPAISQQTYFGIRTFDLDFAGLEAIGVMGLRYDANRKRTEQLEVTVQADVQPILVDPTITETTETINLKSGDLALPLLNLLNWSSVAGQPVAQGTIVFPDNPLVAGQTSSQICITAGTAGVVEPTFSNVAGVTTADNTVVWSSLGSTPPTEIAQDWVQFAPVSLGTLLIPRPLSGCADETSYTAPGLMQNPPLGSPMPKYTVLSQHMGTPGDTMIECTQAGIFGGSTAAQAVVQTFINPSGRSLFICVGAGLTGEFHTTFNETQGALTTDGSVTWQCISAGGVTLPIGGWPGMTPASCYFPTDRGQQSLQNMLARARAKLRRRARAVQVTFQCRLEAVAPTISCRMNAGITDPRLPGGSAVGKVISYKLTRDGDSGSSYAEVTLGCTIGNANTIVVNINGVAVYADGVFDQGAVQVWENATVPGSSTSDIGYTPPVQQVVDDGVVFPLYGNGDVIITSQWHGLASTANPENISDYNAQIQAAVAAGIAASKPIATGSTQITGGQNNAAQLAAAVVAHVNSAVFQGTYLWYELCLKNLQGGPYTAAYVVTTTLLAMPKTIDLAAPSG